MFCAPVNKKRKFETHDASMLVETSPNLKGRSLLSPLRDLQLSPIPRSLQGGVSTPRVQKCSKENLKPLSLKGRGQLKIHIYVNSGLLTIHVIQAKNLISSHDSLCSTFVRVAIVPDETKQLRCKTGLVRDTNKPEYDHKFSYELEDSDMKKRILFSVWHRDQRLDKNEFLGCMSFGIQSVLVRRRGVHGWYYLLPEEYGKRKHLQAVRCRMELMQKANSNIHVINKDLKHMSPHTVVIRKDLTGYGFSVMGSCPARIGVVDIGSPAEEAGLRREDCIVKLNGINVSRSSAESVSKLVRNSEFVALEIQRPYKELVPMDDTLKNPLSSTLQSSHVNSREEDKENGGHYHLKRNFQPLCAASQPLIQKVC